VTITIQHPFYSPPPTQLPARKFVKIRVFRLELADVFLGNPVHMVMISTFCCCVQLEIKGSGTIGAKDPLRPSGLDEVLGGLLQDARLLGLDRGCRLRPFVD